MSVVGTVENNNEMLRGYEQDPIYPYAEAFVNVIKGALTEGYNYFRDTRDYYRNPATRDDMKRFFVENSYDPNDPRYCQNGENANPFALKNIREHTEHMEQLFLNDLSAPISEGSGGATAGILGSQTGLIHEASPLSDFNNVVGMALPVHKMILMNAVFDQVLPKSVSRSPRFTESIETREMIDIHGNRIDMFYEQNKMTPAINESIPQMNVFIPLPEMRTTDILRDPNLLNLPANRKYHLSVKSGVIGIIANSWAAEGDEYWDATTRSFQKVAAGADGIYPVLFSCNKICFDPFYGDFDAVINTPIVFEVYTSATDKAIVRGALSGARYRDDMFHFQFLAEPGSAVQPIGLLFYAAADASSAAFPTVQFEWRIKTKQYQIPDQPHITVTVTPESVKDIQASYDINQITKLMSMMQLGLLHWKDDNILSDLDTSFMTMPDSQKVSAAIDWAPPTQFNGTPRQWRRDMFMEQLDRYVTRMLQVLNDENMTVLVFGSPAIISNITPQDFTYQAPSNIGPVQLDFTKTVCTSNHRVYNFVSSQKLRNDNNLILLLIPRNTMRITYKIIDYQLYVSNELRDPLHYEAPAMTCFERWYFLQFQPVQGRIFCLNTMGTREQIENPNPMGSRALHDDTSHYSTYSSNVNAVATSAQVGTFMNTAIGTTNGNPGKRTLPTSLDGI